MKKRISKEKKTLDCFVYDSKGKKVGAISLNDKVFDGDINVSLLHQVVRMYNANRRSGSASTKTRAEVRGGGKKPWRQKGTGRARTGSIRNPIWRGGGVIFGPRPRDFSYRMPHKTKKTAIRSSLNSKFLDDSLVIINEVKLKEPKTKLFKAVIDSLGIKENESAIFILKEIDNNIKLASRNIPKLSVKAVNNLNAFDILSHKKLIIQQKALKNLMKDLQ